MSLLRLEDAASLLRQLDATRLDELRLLHDGLSTLVMTGGVPSSAQPLAARAARLLGTLVNGTADGSTAVFTDARRSLEAAVALLIATDRAPSDDQLPEDTDHELLGEFLAEGMECLTRAEAGLLRLEAHPEDQDAINLVFRAFHTVKGTSAFLGLSRITDFAHEAESLLSRLRDGEVAYTRECAELALSSSDMLRALLRVVQHHDAATGDLPVPTGYRQLLQALASFAAPPAPRPVAPPAATTAAPPAAPPAASPGHSVPTARSVPEGRRDASAAMHATGNGDAGVHARQDSGGEGTVRVRTDQLDRLIETVEQLVVVHALITSEPHHDSARDPELTRQLTQAETLVRELHTLSRSMRRVELRPTFQKLSRVVRDTAVRTDKQVEFCVIGEDVEIDRQQADLLGDPLVHMVRNAIDHGIECVDERLRLGKPSTGALRLSASQAFGYVVIELVDDGRGLHRDQIVVKARERGLISSDEGMTDSEVFSLIFAPGFSTAERVTSLSGRGVGLDVVRQNLEAMHGRVDIASARGVGTTFSLRFPMMLESTNGLPVHTALKLDPAA